MIRYILIIMYRHKNINIINCINKNINKMINKYNYDYR